jgi:thiamine transport system substrate-binding protein
MNRRVHRVLPLAALLALAACGSSGSSSTSTSAAAATTEAPAPTTAAPTSAAPTTTVDLHGTTITLLTYDAFAAPDSLASFTEQTGITVKIAKGGDAGILVNKAILTKGNPEGDVLWGLDNTLLSRAVGTAGLFVPYVSPEWPKLLPAATALVEPAGAVTPVDTGDVCVNYDIAWFTKHSLTPPSSLDDLTKPAYKDLLVTENPGTSSTGLAFLLATVGKYGPTEYLGWWKDLRVNGVKVVDTWDTAYNDEFTQGGGSGTHPMVVSYASSPPATIIYASDPKPTTPTTGNIDTTCFRQIEFAGILAGTKHEAAARALVDFLIGEKFQADLPLSNFVYPVRSGVALPSLFAEFGKPSPAPFTVAPTDIAAHRDEWVSAWDAAVLH